MKAFEIWKSLSSPESREILEQLFREYRMKSYDELRKLPEVTTTSNNAGLGTANIYRNRIDQDVIEIIIQLYVPGTNLFLIKMAEVESMGFRASPDGQKQNVPDDVIYGYM